MKAEKTDKESGFRRKVYTKMYHSSISQIKADYEKPLKKIVPTTKKLGIREELKKTFLPLLIDVFELRQMIQNHKSNKATSALLSIGKSQLSPDKILEKLTALQQDIEETKRWVEGVISQIDKGISEAKEALEKGQPISTPNTQKSLSGKGPFELSEILDQKYSTSRLLSRLFKRRKNDAC